MIVALERAASDKIKKVRIAASSCVLIWKEIKEQGEQQESNLSEDNPEAHIDETYEFAKDDQISKKRAFLRKRTSSDDSIFESTSNTNVQEKKKMKIISSERSKHTSAIGDIASDYSRESTMEFEVKTVDGFFASNSDCPSQPSTCSASQRHSSYSHSNFDDAHNMPNSETANEIDATCTSQTTQTTCNIGVSQSQLRAILGAQKEIVQRLGEMQDNFDAFNARIVRLEEKIMYLWESKNEEIGISTIVEF